MIMETIFDYETEKLDQRGQDDTRWQLERALKDTRNQSYGIPFREVVQIIARTLDKVELGVLIRGLQEEAKNL